MIAQIVTVPSRLTWPVRLRRPPVAGYPTGNNAATNLPWSPATDGLRNLTGHVNHDGTVTIWAVTSTVSGNGDVGADPNKLVKITDTVAATTLPAGERFATIRTARFAEVLRGVSFTPGTGLPPDRDEDHDDHDRDGHDHDDHGHDGGLYRRELWSPRHARCPKGECESQRACCLG